MGYRRLFIMRKDLNMSPGKLAAQVAHCAEAYWTNMIRNNIQEDWFFREGFNSYKVNFDIGKDIYNNYVNASFTKTICGAKNKYQLLKAKEKAEELWLIEGIHFGLIYDNCLTELTPEEENGTCLTGIWFAPLPDEIAHQISKKYQLL